MNQDALSYEQILENLNQVSNGDMVFNLKICKVFLEEGTKTYNELTQAFEGSDFDQVKQLSHKLKSNTRLFGFERISNQLAALETVFDEDTLKASFNHLPDRWELCVTSVTAFAQQIEDALNA